MNKEEQIERLYKELLNKNANNIQITRKYYKKAKSYARKRQKQGTTNLLRISHMRKHQHLSQSRNQTTPLQSQNLKKLSIKKCEIIKNDNTKTQPTTHHCQDINFPSDLKDLRKREKSHFITESVRKSQKQKQEGKRVHDRGIIKYERNQKKKSFKTQSQKALLNLKQIVFVADGPRRKAKNDGRNSSCENIPPTSNHNRYHSKNGIIQIKQLVKHDFKESEARNFLPSIRKVKEVRINNSSSIFVKQVKDVAISKQSFIIQSIPVHQLNWHSRQI